MNKKQKQVLAELQDWYDSVKNNITWVKSPEEVVFEWGSDRMINAMYRAGYGRASINDVICLTSRGYKLIDTLARNLIVVETNKNFI